MQPPPLPQPQLHPSPGPPPLHPPNLLAPASSPPPIHADEAKEPDATRSHGMSDAARVEDRMTQHARRSEAQLRGEPWREVDTSEEEEEEEMLDFFPDDPHRHARRMEAAQRQSAGSGGGSSTDASLIFAPYLSMEEFAAASRFSVTDSNGRSSGHTSARNSMSSQTSQQQQQTGANSRSGSASGGSISAMTVPSIRQQRRFEFPSVTLPLAGSETASGATTAASTPRFFDETMEDEQRKPADAAAGKGTLQSAAAVSPPEPLQRHASIVPSIVVSIFGGGIYGYTTAIIAGLSVPLVDSAFFSNSPASTRASMQGLLTASILIGGLLGTLGSMPLTARFGRKIALIICGGICVAASVGMGVVNNFLALVLLRGVLGLSVGMSATLCPLYNAETAPPEKRGVVGAVYQLSLVSAILVAEIVNYAFNPSNTVHVSTWVWQTQFILGGLFGAGLVVSGLAIPESLVWLQARERKRKAREHKREMQQRQEARRMSRDEEAQAAEAELANAAARSRKGWRGLFHPSNIRWLALAFMLAGGNQLTGINAVIYYAPVIFKDAGFEKLALVLTIAVVGVWNLLSVLLAMPLIRKYPRRTLMLGAAVIMTVGMALMTIVSFWFSSSRAIPSIIAILLVVLGFELGPGPLFFVISCLQLGTKVKLHDGRSVAVEELSVGSILAGTRGQHVTVLHTAQGVSPLMYVITHSDGSSYTVTPDHRVTLVWRRNSSVLAKPAPHSGLLPFVQADWFEWRDGAPVQQWKCWSFNDDCAANTADTVSSTGPLGLRVRCSHGSKRTKEASFTWVESDIECLPESPVHTDVSEAERVERMELWLESVHPLADTSSGQAPEEGSRLEHGSVFELTASQLSRMLPKLRLDDQCLVGAAREFDGAPMKPIDIVSAEAHRGASPFVSVEVSGDRRFQLSDGTLTHNSEAYPSPILHAGLSLSNQLAWACNIAITFLFPLMNAQLGTAGTFGVFLLINAATLVAYSVALPHHVEHAVITATPEPGLADFALALADEPNDEQMMRGKLSGADDDNKGKHVKEQPAGSVIELTPSPPAGYSGGSKAHTATVNGPTAGHASGATSWQPQRDRSAVSCSPPYQAQDQLYSEAQLLHSSPQPSPPYVSSSSTPHAQGRRQRAAKACVA